MKIKEVPDLTSVRYPKPAATKVSLETHEQLQKLRTMGKDVSKFIRGLIERELAEIFPENQNRAG